MIFLYIMEDGYLTISSTFPEEDVAACDDGILDVIDLEGSMSDTASVGQPLQYRGGEWHQIDEIDRSLYISADDIESANE